jgi:hypothetical protein
VLVAQNGEVFIDHAFGVAQAPKYMPRTTLPQFQLGDITKVFTEMCAAMPAQRGRGQAAAAPDTTGGAAPPAAGRGRGRGGPPPSPLQQCVSRISTLIGAHQSSALDSLQIQSSVDELYRLALLLHTRPALSADSAKAWTLDTYKGEKREAAYATADGKRAAFVLLPDRHATIVILTNDPNADAKAMAQRIVDQVIAAPKG